jgi:hypothetical protein
VGSESHPLRYTDLSSASYSTHPPQTISLYYNHINPYIKRIPYYSFFPCLSHFQPSPFFFCPRLSLSLSLALLNPFCSQFRFPSVIKAIIPPLFSLLQTKESSCLQFILCSVSLNCRELFIRAHARALMCPSLELGAPTQR